MIHNIVAIESGQLPEGLVDCAKGY